MPPAENLATLMRHWIEAVTMRSMHEASSYVRATGLSMPQFGVLMFLFHGDGCGTHSIGVNDVGQRMEVTGAAASQLIERLVQAGLVERTENPADRRGRLIALTDKGRTLVEQGFAERHRWLDEFVALLSADDQQTVLAALPRLIAAEAKLSALKGPHSE